MTLKGTVKSGVIVLENGCSLPEGTAVEVTPTRPRAASSLGEALLRHAGTAVGLPEDLAAEHDHYIHGMPKRQ